MSIFPTDEEIMEGLKKENERLLQQVSDLKHTLANTINYKPDQSQKQTFIIAKKKEEQSENDTWLYHTLQDLNYEYHTIAIPNENKTKMDELNELMVKLLMADKAGLRVKIAALTYHLNQLKNNIE